MDPVISPQGIAILPSKDSSVHMRNLLAALVVLDVRTALCGTCLTKVNESRLLVTIHHIVCVVPVLEYILKESQARLKT